MRSMIGSELVLIIFIQDAPTGSLDAYSYKSHADDLAELGKQLGCENIVLAGHDWYVLNYSELNAS